MKKESKTQIWSEVLWNPLVGVIFITAAFVLFTMTAVVHGYSEPAFILSFAWIGILGTMGALSAGHAVSQFTNARLLDITTFVIVLSILATLGALALFVDMSQFQDAAVKAAASSVPAGMGAVLMKYFPKGGKEPTQQKDGA